MDLRTCGRCFQEKSLENFSLTVKGFHRRICKDCRNQDSVKSKKKQRSTAPERFRKYNNRHREDNPHLYIVYDCRKTDKRNGFDENDLTADLVSELIAKGCLYCGETALRMTLDRIDNGKAHTKDNVNECCLRCNYLRGSMPYAAWEHIVPAVKSARSLGLFGQWRTRPLNKRIA